MVNAGFAQVDITPTEPVDLAGYFTRRVSSGVLDPLRAKAMVLDDGDTRLAVVAVDLVGFPSALVAALRERIGDEFPHLMVTCTHTHTGPVIGSSFVSGTETGYIATTLLPGIERACREAAAALGPFRVLHGEAIEKGVAFCRRYWMRDGRVMTNPPKGYPDIVRPESEIDHGVHVFAFEQDGVTRAIVVNASNHTDTIGGNEISADWPGHMARYVCEELGRDVPLMLLNGPSGNVNHFDPDRPERQASYAESKRVGLGYATAVRTALARATEIDASTLGVQSVTRHIPYREVSEADLAAARETLKTELEVEEAEGDLTAEDLAKGDPRVDRMYAQHLLGFAELRKERDGEDIEINAFRLGDVGFVGLPGEPFCQIGTGIKAESPFAVTAVFALCNGVVGYVPMPEHFERGGYEPKTTRGNRLARTTGETFIAEGLAALAELA